jgi:formate dehydrogenase (NADP+) beta subunit
VKIKMVVLKIDGIEATSQEGTTILNAALKAGIYIPHLCFHSDLAPFNNLDPAEAIYQGEKRIENKIRDLRYEGCELCMVEIEGHDGFQRACNTKVANGMVVKSASPEIERFRRERLMTILSGHPHACLICAQKEGCARFPCSMNIPEDERCCPKFGSCEFQKVAEYIGINPETPRYTFENLPVLNADPLIKRDYNLCIGCTRCIRICKEVRGVEALGFVFDEKGRIKVGSLAPSLRESECRFCTACVAVCPTGALTDKNTNAEKTSEEAVPCISACPVNIDIPGYIRLIKEGKADEANAVIRQKMPFPGVLGRVCVRPCEEVCKRGEINEAVSICALKRFAADNEQGTWKDSIRILPDSGHKVAVIGSGPAGLTAAFYLRKFGHQVTVFESRPFPGGMMRYGIPDYRLPASVVEKEIKDILDLGVELKSERILGTDFSLDDLRNEGYEAIFLALGAQLSRKIALENLEIKGVIGGVDFLRQVKEGKSFDIKGKVVVIGGGNVAVDAALTALRYGATHVTMVCLENKEEMPADEWEINQAAEEGVEILATWGPNKILCDNDKLSGCELIGCSCVFDETGNFSPKFDERLKDIDADQIILAIGQEPDLAFTENSSAIVVQKGMIATDKETLATGDSGVFAGGDVTGYPGSIVDAIKAGRKAAVSIDLLLGGKGNIEDCLLQSKPSPNIGKMEGFFELKREKVPQLSLKKRAGNFKEVALGFDLEQARKEAIRCLQCDLRLGLSKPVLPPKKKLWLELIPDNISELPKSEGVYQFFDEEENVICIKGSTNLREEIEEQMKLDKNARFFVYEEEPMYTKRESELLQQYIAEHGEMPKGNQDLDDLF